MTKESTTAHYSGSSPPLMQPTTAEWRDIRPHRCQLNIFSPIQKGRADGSNIMQNHNQDTSLLFAHQKYRTFWKKKLATFALCTGDRDSGQWDVLSHGRKRIHSWEEEWDLGVIKASSTSLT